MQLRFIEHNAAVLVLSPARVSCEGVTAGAWLQQQINRDARR
jgi:hypothetical protein